MANQQLVDYIKSQLAVGVTKDDLRRAIADAGWTSADAQGAFDVVEGKAPALPVMPLASPKASQGAAPGTPIQARPVSPGMPVLTPVRRPRRRHKYLPWLLLALALFVLLGAAIYFVPTLRDIAGWYLEGMPQTPNTSALVPVQEPVTAATSTQTTATSTATSTPITASSTPTNIIITSTSTATTTP